jgi:hypothetical protein
MSDRLRHPLAALVFACVLAAACRKGPEAAVPVTSRPTASAPAPAPASVAASTGNTDAALGAGGADTTAKLAGAEWALRQDAIKNDPDGQWAIQSKASSSYNDAEGTASWSSNQATGVPNVEKYADDGKAWAPKTPDGGIEWLDLTFPKPVFATEVRIRESCGSGAVIRVELFDEKSTPHVAWAGNDPTKDLNYLLVKFEKTTYRVDRVKVTLATNVVPGWNEIDAVQLVGKDN